MPINISRGKKQNRQKMFYSRDSSTLTSTFQIVAVKTEPKMEPGDGSTGQYSLADLDGITDLLPIQTGERERSP